MVLNITVRLHKTIPHPYVCGRKTNCNQVIHSSLYHDMTHTHRKKQSWNQPEIREDSLALSAVLFSPFPYLQRIAARANLSACTGKVERAFSAHLMMLQYIVETLFTDTTDEGCYTAASGLISRYKKLFLF